MNQLPLPSFHVLSAVCLLLAAFIVVPWLANALAATTDVSVSSGPGTAFAVVEGTRLDVPPDKLRARDGRPLEFSASQTTSLEGPSSSLYWQAAWAGPFAFLGKMGEWLQTLRPAAGWGHVGASKGQAGDAHTSRYRLKGGRTPATITLTPLNPSDPKMAFVIRGERRTIAWWRVEGGQPVEQLASGTYRPTFTMALGD